MPNSDFETFWDRRSFAVVGNSAKGKFPLLTFRGLKQLGKTVFPVDPSANEVEGEEVYPDLQSLPAAVDAVVIEVSKEDTEGWIAQAATIGVRHVWIHMGRETPEALALAEKHGLDVKHGTCAVMYLNAGLTYHSFHKWINQLSGRY